MVHAFAEPNARIIIEQIPGRAPAGSRGPEGEAESRPKVMVVVSMKKRMVISLAELSYRKATVSPAASRHGQ